MAIQYSGTNVNTTFTCTTGTRREIVDGVSAALVSAGWTIISGSGTGDVLLESATTTSPQSLTMRVRLFDPGTGNCAQIKPRNVANTNAMTNYLPLLPAASKVFRVIANPYQAFIFTSSSASTAREYAAFGMPFLPSFLQGVITECIWAHANGFSDTDTSVKPTFRTGLWAGRASNYPATWNNVNGNLVEIFNSAPSTDNGTPQLFVQCGSLTASATTVQYRWHDDSLLTYEPIIGWGLTSVSDEGKIRGQLWDAVVVNDGFTADSTTSFDTHNWHVLTNGNTGSTGSLARGSLLLVIP